MSKSHELHSDPNTKEFRFPQWHSVFSACRQVKGTWTLAWLHWWMQDPFNQADPLIFTMQQRSAPQPDLESFPSHSAVPHFSPPPTLPLLGLLPCGPRGGDGHECLSLGWGACCRGHKGGRRHMAWKATQESCLTGVNWRVHHTLINRHLSQAGSWSARGLKRDSPVAGFSSFQSDNLNLWRIIIIKSRM